MRIGEMFYKPIDRDIKGVIKVGQGDDSNVYQELEEYVVTRELSKHLNDFFEAYKKGIVSTTDKMGVWISGFFGSGKSHFLKILSYLLENKEANGKRAIQYFDDKIHDSMLLADIKLAGATSADVVLFNIDSKSDSDSKSNKDAIVKVFMKVFNEMQGKAPYGWLEEDIEWVIGKLFKSQDIKLQLNSQYLDVNDRDIVKYLTKRDYADRLLIEKRIKVPPHQINIAKELCKELFNITALPADEDGIINRFKDLARNELAKINELMVYYRQTAYPSQGILQEGEKVLEAISEAYRDAKEFGSILNIEQRNYDGLLAYLIQLQQNGTEDLFMSSRLNNISANMSALIRQAKIMSQKYDVVVTNPPYMGSKGMNNQLADYVQKEYREAKADLFSVFHLKCLDMAKRNRYISMITMESWMFLSGFEEMRKRLLNNITIVSLVHMPYLGKGGTSIGIAFGTSAFVYLNISHKKYNARYCCIRYFETDQDGKPFDFPTINESHIGRIKRYFLLLVRILLWVN